MANWIMAAFQSWVDAAILAQLYASGFLPEVWIPDEATQAMRRQVSRRAQIANCPTFR